MIKCKHDDCFTCPYDDCICDKAKKSEKTKKEKLSPEELKRHRQETNKKYYNRNSSWISEYKRELYKKKKAGRIEKA